MKVLLAAATEAEIAPTLSFLQSNNAAYHDVDVCITGVGLLPATYALMRKLMRYEYDIVLQAGIAGAFKKDIPLGSLVIVKSEELGDLGAEDGDAFIDVFTLGFSNKDEFPFTGGKLINPLKDIIFNIDDIPPVSGLTVHTVSGQEQTISSRLDRHNDVAVESMEGAALHYVCLQSDVPFLQLRAISNYVTRRDRSAWKIGAAIDSLNKQIIQWLSILG